jgi:hypothetical protein
MRKREGVHLCRMLRQGVGSGADEMPASHVPKLFWGVSLDCERELETLCTIGGSNGGVYTCSRSRRPDFATSVDSTIAFSPAAQTVPVSMPIVSELQKRKSDIHHPYSPYSINVVANRRSLMPLEKPVGPPPAWYQGNITTWGLLNDSQRYKIVNADKIREQARLQYEKNKDRLKELREQPNNKQRISDYNKQYRTENRESENNRHKEWREKNAESLPGRRRDHYDRNKERILAHGREWKQRDEFKLQRKAYDNNNRDHNNITRREYYANNSEDMVTYKRKYRHKKDMEFYEMFGEGLGM